MRTPRTTRIAAMGAAAMVLCLCLGQRLSAAENRLSLLTQEFPRAFHFRRSEAIAAKPSVPYEEWESNFSVLDGIMGKCLDEEIPNRSQRNIGFFTRYKHAHPDKAVLLHFNGNARDPRFETDSYFGGHWLYFNGCRITQDLEGTPEATCIHVEDPGLFHAQMGRFQDKNEDLGLCVVDAAGRPDWSQSEQLELISIEAAANTLRVRRGAFGTQPRPFPKGAYIAAHVTEGPWGKQSNLLWSYNYAVPCPRDPSDAVCSDRLRADLLRWFGPDGPLAAFDGVEFDVLYWDCPGGLKGPRFADTDADGQPDGGVIGGVNVYGLGVHRHLVKLREEMDPGRLLMADGHSVHNQRSVAALNGIESEGWPSLQDAGMSDWSGGLNRHAYWEAHAHPRTFSYINHKFMERGTPLDVPFSTTRLVMAAAQFTGSGFTFSYAPPEDGSPPLDVWDELVLGTERKNRWLGAPIEAARHLGFGEEDLLAGEGARLSAEFFARWHAGNATLGKDAAGLCLAGLPADQETICAEFSHVKVPPGDLLIRLL